MDASLPSGVLYYGSLNTVKCTIFVLLTPKNPRLLWLKNDVSSCCNSAVISRQKSLYRRRVQQSKCSWAFAKMLRIWNLGERLWATVMLITPLICNTVFGKRLLCWTSLFVYDVTSCCFSAVVPVIWLCI